MDKIIWSDDYSVGIEEIDNQHRRIVNEINKLIELNDKEGISEEVNSVVSKILSYAIMHLSYEEDLLIDNDYPDFEQHFEKHNEYRNAFYNLLSGSPDSIEDIFHYLQQWWNEHILEEDMKYKDFFAQKRKPTVLQE